MMKLSPKDVKKAAKSRLECKFCSRASLSPSSQLRAFLARVTQLWGREGGAGYGLKP